MKTIVLITTFIFCFLNIKAQNFIKNIPDNTVGCYFDQGEQKNINNIPYQKLKEKNHKAYLKYIEKSANKRTTGEILKLPVIVHVISPNTCISASSNSIRYSLNPSDELIENELNDANKRFRHKHQGARTYSNPYYGVDTEIELYLAKVDPNGAYTSGIIHYTDPAATLKSIWELGEVANKYKWDTKKYINIFIFDRITDAAGVYFPDYDITMFDGKAFWSGLICHEIGHYFSLNHIFGYVSYSECPSNTDCLNSGDNVCDTPPKYTAGKSEGFTCSNPPNSCSTDEADLTSHNPYRPIALGGMGDQPDMLENYMDYTGGCWDAYTLGQKNMMRANISLRTEMLANAAGIITGPAKFYDINSKELVLQDLSCQGISRVKVPFQNKGKNALNSVKVDLFRNGVLQLTQEWDGILAFNGIDTVKFEIPALSDGTYDFSVQLKEPNGLSDLIFQNANCQSIVVSSEGLNQPFIYDFSNCLKPESLKFVDAVDVKLTIGNYYMPCSMCSMKIFNNWGKNELQKVKIILPEMDLTNFENPVFSFSYGFIPDNVNDNNDVIKVNVSAGCLGLKTIWQQSGLELATNNPQQFVDYIPNSATTPNCKQIKTNNISLRDFVSNKNVKIYLELTGGLYNPLFFESMTIADQVKTSFDDKIFSSFIVENPLKSRLIINNKLKENYVLCNLHGQIIKEFSEKDIDVSDLSTGFYLLIIEGENYRNTVKLIKE